MEFREGRDPNDLMSALRDHDPHVVIVFRPETVPPGLFAGLDALTVGWSTEPLPRGRRNVHPDLSWRLSELALVDRTNFDRVVTFDPLSVAAAESQE